MRTKQEINQALGILYSRGDKISMLQADILENRRSARQIFQKMVMDVPQESRDEDAFFAARDAGMFLEGKLELEDFLPEVEPQIRKESEQTKVKVSVSLDYLITLTTRIERLEKQVCFLLERRNKSVYKHQADANKQDYLTQTQAYKYIGCSQLTLIRWTKDGMVRGYRKGSHVYYSKSELDINPTVQNFRNLK